MKSGVLGSSRRSRVVVAGLPLRAYAASDGGGPPPEAAPPGPPDGGGGSIPPESVLLGRWLLTPPNPVLSSMAPNHCGLTGSDPWFGVWNTDADGGTNHMAEVQALGPGLVTIVQGPLTVTYRSDMKSGLNNVGLFEGPANGPVALVSGTPLEDPAWADSATPTDPENAVSVYYLAD